MASLLDTLDRFNYTASSIRSLTSSQQDQSTPGPFTSAILNSSLEDILREADEAEYGLFTFVKDPSVILGDGHINQGRVGRKEFRGVTPLKPKRAADTNKDEEPEVYVEAALKYLDRFRAIKSMPHVHTHLESLIDRLNTVRDNVERLQTSIEDQSHSGRISPKSQIAEEERRISELKSRVLQLRKRPKHTSSSSVSDTPSSATSTPTSQPLRSKANSKPSSLTNVRVDKSDSLLDEELDMTGMDSMMSSIHQERPPLQKTRDPGVDDDGGEPTIVISKLPRESKPPASSPAATPLPPSRSHSQASTIDLQTPVQESKHGLNRVDPPSTKTKIRRTRITPEMERVSAKVWSVIPDLLVPGNNFGSPGNAPPKAKDTLTILQTIASQPIPDATSNASSPSTRSTLSSLLGIEIGPTGGTPHQIMTALVLLTLFTAPNHSMPLTDLKGLLASKNAAALGASASQVGTRALYGCVAKKLVKIDRGGGEQIVKFD
ncbi:hypothetical protein BU17DRAFT_42929 [Hysterangium stoloniferum]|nr:hypothetical protein BU17DRAFT_42929 [Hysterangium stoloniferum]